MAASAPRWVAGILVVLIGVRLAALLTASGPPPAPPPSGDVAVAAPRPAADLPSILRANLFGSAPAANSNPANAPTTNLALVLSGIVADADPARGLALIGPTASALKVYAVGAALPGGARLHSVLPDRVLLDRGGSLESLPLPRRFATGAPPPPPPPVAGGERVRQFVQENPGVIGQVLRPQAVMADGRQRGYRIYPGPNQAAFNRLGLRAGDLVTAINGTTLDDPSRGGEIFSTLSSVAEARVTVIRNGAQQEIVLNLADVANDAQTLDTQPVDPAQPNEATQ
ncbi:MAG: type II secretion system protein GspC [Nevskiaceae bacterium]|jgi:general secretion pathway protein C|nr:type II secretion system protein GspC [Nevskiaceae bacterium]